MKFSRNQYKRNADFLSSNSGYCARYRALAFTVLLRITVLCQIGWLQAAPVAVRYVEGSSHGYLALRTMAGRIIAEGDLVQAVAGDRVTSHLVFHFRDGSIDEETSIFSQHTDFRLIRDHHIQKGPSFPTPSDVLIDVPTGQVTVRSTDKGVAKVEMSHLDLPSDLANGIVLDVVKNIAPGTPETKLSYLAATPKPRLIKLSITPHGETPFSVAGVPQEAKRFAVKVELGGLTGVLAPLIGKEPAAISVWIVGGGAPAFVRSEGYLYLGGPIWKIEMVSPVWSSLRRSGH